MQSRLAYYRLSTLLFSSQGHISNRAISRCILDQSPLGIWIWWAGVQLKGSCRIWLKSSKKHQRNQWASTFTPIIYTCSASRRVMSSKSQPMGQKWNVAMTWTMHSGTLTSSCRTMETSHLRPGMLRTLFTWIKCVMLPCSWVHTWSGNVGSPVDSSTPQNSTA